MSNPTPQPGVHNEVDYGPGTVTLPRVLGPGMAIAIVVGNVIGSGIFAKPGRIAAEAGRFDLIISVWVAGGLLCLLGALCFAELAVMLPRAGGMYVYLREAYGKVPAFLYGWQEFLFNRPASLGALATMCVSSLGKVLGLDFTIVESLCLSIGLVTGLAFVNIVGVLWGGRMQAATTLIKAGFVVFVAVLPFILELGGREIVDFALYSQRTTPTTHGLAAQTAAVLLAVMWAYNGWDGIAPVAEEIRNPQRNIPLALFGGIGLLALLYLSANLSYYAVIPMSVMAQPENQKHVAELMVSNLLGPIGGSLMSAGVMLSTLGAMNSNLLISPRVTFAMGRDRVFFPVFGQVHARFRTPVAAIAVQAGMGAVLMVGAALVVGGFPQYFRERSVFDLLTDCIIFASSIFYSLSVVAVMVLRRRQPDRERPYRTPGYPVVPLLYLTVYTWFLASIFLGQPVEALIGLGLILLGLPVYFHCRKQQQASGGNAPADRQP